MIIDKLIDKMDDYVRLSVEISDLMRFCENECFKIFHLINNSKNFSETNLFFDELENLHNKLSIISFKYGYPLTDKLNNIVSNFERIDDKNTRDFWFLRIKESTVSGFERLY